MIDLIELESTLKNQIQDQKPFVLYSLPGSKEVKVLLQKESKLDIIEDFSESGFAFVSFDRKKQLLISLSNSEEATFEIAADYVSNNTSYRKDDAQPSAKANFEKIVAKAIVAIENGEFGKVVLSRKETQNVDESKSFEIYLRVLKTYPNAYCYCFYHPESGIWIGATPEKLLKVSGNSFTTMALAGTQKIENSAAELTWETKEQEEQAFVTDFIVNGIENAVDDLKISTPYTAQAGTIAHIKTDISGVLKEVGDVEYLVKVLHPTPAVCGMPKDKATHFINNNEGYSREFYSGFLGELNMPNKKGKLQTDFYVNLRCMKVEQEQAQIFVGCGITKDSNPEKEYYETVNKSQTMKKILI